MAAKVYVTLCYGINLNEEALSGRKNKNYPHYGDFLYSKMTDEYKPLRIITAQGMYDDDTTYVVALKSSIIKANEDIAVSTIPLVSPSEAEVALLKRFVGEIGFKPVEPEWKLTVDVDGFYS